MGRQHTEIRQKILQYVKKEYCVPEHDTKFSDTVDLFEEGYVDSLKLIKFIAFLEDEFNVDIEEEYLYDERFLTIAGQSEIIFELINWNV
jgi:acyl carrier protein